MKPLRYLYLGHRWLGIIMCSFFAMWFFSGVVMMYISFPNLTETERLNTLPALNSEEIKLPVTVLTSQLPDDAIIEQLKLSSVLNRPAYILKNGESIMARYLCGYGQTVYRVFRAAGHTSCSLCTATI